MIKNITIYCQLEWSLMLLAAEGYLLGRSKYI
jgi:hypothetical protein